MKTHMHDATYILSNVWDTIIQFVTISSILGVGGNGRDWSPHMSFILKGSQIWALKLKAEFKSKTSIQEYRNEMQNSYYTCAWIILVHASSATWRIKNPPSNCTSCSDNALRLLVLVAGNLYWGLQVRSSYSIWGCVLKGCFERSIFCRPKSCLKGIEDFNLEQWPERFLGIITGWYPSACKSNRLHVHILRFPFIELGWYIL